MHMNAIQMGPATWAIWAAITKHCFDDFLVVQMQLKPIIQSDLSQIYDIITFEHLTCKYTS